MIAIVLSRQVLWAAVWPESLDFSEQVGSVANTIVDWITSTFYFITTTFNEYFTVTFLNPLQDVLANSPWYLTIIMISVIAAIIGGRGVAILSFVLLGLVVLIGLWNDTMITLAQVLIATVITMVIGVVLGVMAGRSERVETYLKPFLDAGQTMPAFVYLVPVLALFGPTRFAAIVCGVFYAAPVVVRVVADGVRGVPTEMVEAATSAGSTPTQIITKVQLPASKKSLLLGRQPGTDLRAGRHRDRRVRRRGRPRIPRHRRPVEAGAGGQGTGGWAGDRAAGHHPGPDHAGELRAVRAIRAAE